MATATESLTRAFTQLLERVGHTDPQVNIEDPDWFSITAIDPDIEVDEIGAFGSWPRTSNAIVKFQSQSIEEPYIDDNGFQRPNITESYYLVADIANKKILGEDNEPMDAANKLPAGWVSYTLHSDPSSPGNPKAAPTRLYTVLKGGESAWVIAKKLNFDAKEFIEHNDIKTPNFIPAGTVLHLPGDRNLAGPPVIRIVLYDELKPMHVNRFNGTHRIGFGDAKTWDDLKTVGKLFRVDTPLLIAGEAHVPLEKGDVAKYYLDPYAVGDYIRTQRLAYTIGFNHAHLSEGHVELTVLSEPDIDEGWDDKLVQIKDELEAEAPVISTTWKDSYVPLEKGDETFYFKYNVFVYDIETKRPTKELSQDTSVSISGTFVGPNGATYYRPTDSVRSGHWFGIELDDLRSRDEHIQYLKDLYNTDVPFEARLAAGKRGRFTLKERVIKKPLFKLSAKIYKYAHKEKD